MYKYIIIALILSIIFIILSSTVFKGFFGELAVKIHLKRLIKKNNYLINNLIIEIDNKSNQIDHIIISNKGIFCIETKNYSGTIYGDDKRKEWTQVFNYGKQKYSFYSPVIQNKNHIKALNTVFNKDYNIYNIVIFYKNQIDKIDSKYVYTIKSFKKYYNSLSNSISDLEKEEIYQLLLNIKNNQISNKQHIKNINNNK